MIRTFFRRLRTFFRRICTLWQIAKTYEQDKITLRANVRQELQAMDKLIRDRTTLHADISMTGRDPSFVILVGRYRNRDYVQTFYLPSEDFGGLVDQCVHMSRKLGRWGRLDAPPIFHAAFEREFHPDHDNHPDSNCNCPSCR